MSKNLIFSESPTKRKTIKSFLNQEKFEVFATGGHLNELTRVGYNNLGIKDLENFTPQYQILESKKKSLNFWKSFLKKNSISTIYLATDPDREGEYIASQIINYLELDPKQCKRLLFYEITPQSVKEALKNPLDLNHQIVEAQMSRRILDRMIGFCLSPLLQKQLKALSAGRVQSVVLRLIVDREIAIREHEQKKEFIIQGTVKIDGKKFFFKQKDEKGNLITYPSQKEAEKIKSQLSSKFKLLKLTKQEKYIFPKPPLTTSLLLYEAKLRLDFSIAKTTSLAQQLYEGIWLKVKKQQTSLITYMRTDSQRLNKNFINQAYQYIQKSWNKEYCQFSLKHQEENKKINVQDAHEAIRPTYFSYFPSEVEESLNKEQLALYNLIFFHTLASLMKPAKAEKSIYTFLNNDFFFEMSESVLEFPGFFVLNSNYYLSHYKIKKTSSLEQKSLDYLQEVEIEVKEYLEIKPKRYNEGDLVQKLEKLGIGRPSTYNMFSKILLQRNYVNYNNDKQKQLMPTELGLKVDKWLRENFPSLINVEYTAELEKKLDQISKGEDNYLNFIRGFWKDFFPKVREIEKQNNIPNFIGAL